MGFTADGASVNGVRKGSAPVAAPIPGPTGNLAHSLLVEKRQYSDENILVCWPWGSNGVGGSVTPSLLHNLLTYLLCTYSSINSDSENSDSHKKPQQASPAGVQ